MSLLGKEGFLHRVPFALKTRTRTHSSTPRHMHLRGHKHTRTLVSMVEGARGVRHVHIQRCAYAEDVCLRTGALQDVEKILQEECNGGERDAKRAKTDE